MLAKARKVLTALVVVGLVGVVLTANPPAATALNGADFNPGYIISDAQFYARDAMSQDEIQSFLNAQGGSCQDAQCLRSLHLDTPSVAAEEYCSAYAGAAGESAASIIFKVQAACNISAKVILVTLQKEQALVTRSSTSDAILRKAMGMGCPDTSVCDAQYYGFFNQVYAASRQFNRYNHGSFTWYKVGGTSNVQYSPTASCGSSQVQIKNNATAALYYYTPYQPNASALANLGGTGDGCGSYGNRNFWVFYNSWFGPPDLAASPVANLDVFTAVPGGIRVAGWAFDPDTSNSIAVHIYINGVGTAILANNIRPDVGAAWPAIGSAHGFDVTLPTTKEGPQQVCVYGINVGPGGNTQVTCQTLPGMTGSPGGVLDSVYAVAGVITATGWTFDPDTSASIPVHLYVDSIGTAFVADDARSDLAQVYPAYGAAHGYTRSVKASPGVHTVCAYGIESAGLGTNKQLGCKSVNVAGGSPIGVLDAVYVNPGTITATGWVFDPDTTASTPVHVYSDASGVVGAADQPRADVGAAYPGYGGQHGYSVTFAATPGTHTVCSYGIDIVSPGANRGLGCRTITAMSGSPIGVIDSISAAGGSITAAGWAYDPDTAASIPVHVYVDGVGAAYTAPNPRADFGAVYPAYGPNHGYYLNMATTPGTHNVCVYGINIGPGSNTLIGCKTVTS
ncbi:hypothetical protein QN354_08415 [Cryobacterium sp. 5I3]|uniref:hypothetical protein n=4 Tax=Bacteria TaxID=2 RepID=UPI002B22BAEB|nr:hypothetical protein [Cryobacterium sp. 5I3]MEB0201779.1 hypothetical protein [Cryobacterium sp. 5I3]